MRWRHVPAGLAVLLLLVPLAHAESTHEQAVLELLDLMGMEAMVQQSATTMIDVQLQQNPALEPYRDVLVEWTQRYMTWDNIAPEMVKLYAATFTEPEIRELSAFYRTPTGAKALASMPELFQKGAAIGVSIAERHAPELERMIMKRIEELGAADTEEDTDESTS